MSPTTHNNDISADCGDAMDSCASFVAADPKFCDMAGSMDYCKQTCGGC